jgi:hypothetical protein
LEQAEQAEQALRSLDAQLTFGLWQIGWKMTHGRFLEVPLRNLLFAEHVEGQIHIS